MDSVEDLSEYFSHFGCTVFKCQSHGTSGDEVSISFSDNDITIYHILGIFLPRINRVDFSRS